MTKQLSQLRIISSRVSANTGPMGAKWRIGGPEPNLIDTMVLDVETFYTVAADCLKLVKIFLDQSQQNVFHSEPAYKAISGIRSALIRHAYDKPNGDPSSRFAFSPEQGLMLKCWSTKQRDDGYAPNLTAFWALLKKYKVVDDQCSPSFPLLTQKFSERLTGA